MTYMIYTKIPYKTSTDVIKLTNTLILKILVVQVNARYFIIETHQYLCLMNHIIVAYLANHYLHPIS